MGGKIISALSTTDSICSIEEETKERKFYRVLAEYLSTAERKPLGKRKARAYYLTIPCMCGFELLSQKISFERYGELEVSKLDRRLARRSGFKD